ncbi:uncharacterized protein LOC118229687, partial [Anguilla anguilla]|uniref:uncharacterized protein LOC118229687 n=1 Tax=Anguilla anguilla TaxID=7936 RepID=UPI0015AD1BDD
RFNGVIYSRTKESTAHVLEEEISSLLHKGAIRVVPRDQAQHGFYSRYFLVPKKDGSLRPILDLRVLNKHLRQYNFKMLTYCTLLRSIRQNDWFTSIDLKDAFFHVGIYPPHTKFLRFAHRSVCYEYTVLPFGLSLSPRVFCHCVEAGLAPLRLTGVRILTYIDDWLIIANSKVRVVQDTQLVLTHLSSLGFRVNLSKSNLSPSQSVTFLGLDLNSVSMRAWLSADRILSLRVCLSQFKPGSRVQYRTYLRLQGLMASASHVLPLGLFRMRSFMRCISSLHLSPVSDLHRRLSVTRECYQTLRHWENTDFYTQGTPLDIILMRKVVTTDASLSGWGATQEGRIVNGKWPIQLCVSRRGCTGPPMARCAPLCVSSPRSHLSHSSQSERTELDTDPDSTQVAEITVAGRDYPSPLCTAMRTPVTHGPTVSGERGNTPPPPRANSSLGLARERYDLIAIGVPSRVAATIQCARAPSTRSLYEIKWQVFEGWCASHQSVPYQCSVADVLCFLQDLMDKG